MTHVSIKDWSILFYQCGNQDSPLILLFMCTAERCESNGFRTSSPKQNTCLLIRIKKTLLCVCTSDIFNQPVLIQVNFGDLYYLYCYCSIFLVGECP